MKNGKPRPLTGLAEGIHTIEARDLPPDAWVDPTLAGQVAEKDLTPKAKASSSYEAHGWGSANLFAPGDDAGIGIQECAVSAQRRAAAQARNPVTERTNDESIYENSSRCPGGIGNADIHRGKCKPIDGQGDCRCAR